MRLSAIAVAAALAAMPFAAPVTAQAQDEQPSASKMKGPPNANGYDKEKMGDTVVKDDKDASGEKMKGPPNANGYKKDQ